MMNYLRLAALGVSAAAVVSFAPPGGGHDKGPKYIDPANMDRSVKPGDNFFRYANGTWLKNHSIPASKTSWGSFTELREESSRRMQKLLTEAAAKANTDAKMQKIGDLYSSGM